MRKCLWFLFSPLFAVLLVTGCTSWIEEPTQPFVIPSTLDEYERVLNDSYPGIEHAVITALLSDVLTSVSEEEAGISPLVRNAFLWGDADDPREAFRLSYSGPWLLYYNSIYKANYVISELDTSKNASNNRDRALSLMAEAHLLRAHCYLMLNMLYAETYDESTALLHLGVPAYIGGRWRLLPTRTSVLG